MGALGFLLLSHPTLASPSRLPSSPGYLGRDSCPKRCGVTGPNPSDWPVYHNLGQLDPCGETLFYEFNIHDMVDNEDDYHRVYACGSYGADWATIPRSATPAATVVESVNATYEINWSSSGAIDTQECAEMAEELRQYLTNGHANGRKKTILFVQSGSTSLGIYIGAGLSKEHTSSVGLKILQSLADSDKQLGSNLAVQLCHSSSDGDHIFGVMASADGGFTSIQAAMQSWSQGKCLQLDEAKAVQGQAAFTTLTGSLTNETTTVSAPLNYTSIIKQKRAHPHHIHHVHSKRKVECRTAQVASGDSCGSLATKCGISPSDFNKYNSDSKLCSSLAPGQHVCCSSGPMPDFAPKPDSDGMCATYTVNAGDNCADIGAANSLTNKDIEMFNKKTWGWTGCDRILTGAVICLSKGKPPMPSPMSNAVCGPQKPGTKAPKDGTDIAQLNPCPLNACCDIWGQVRLICPQPPV